MCISDWSSDVCSSDLDVVDFEKGNCSLGLAMGVEHLALIRLPLGHVSIAAPISSVVRDQHELEHMIMQRLRHLIESADVQIQSWDRKHVRAITKIARQRSEESRVGKECVRKCRSRWAPNH